MTLQLPDNWSKKKNEQLREKFTQKLASRLKEVREEKDMTQQEVAEKAGLHLTYLGHLELGRYHPSTYVIWKIAKALNVPVSKLIHF